MKENVQLARNSLNLPQLLPYQSNWAILIPCFILYREVGFPKFHIQCVPNIDKGFIKQNEPEFLTNEA